MKLPTGYTQLEYIESTGTQYIDTGYKPTGNTRVVMDHESFSVSSGYPTMFGARNSNGAGGFVCHYSANTNLIYWYYNSNTPSLEISDPWGRHIIDFDKNMLYRDGSLLSTQTLQSFTSSTNLYLFALRYGTTVPSVHQCRLRLYSCQIYDNGTLIRDFVPCMNSSGSVGLYDIANNVFYGNNGSGTFLYQKCNDSFSKINGYVNINGVSCRIPDGHVNIDGVSHRLLEGYVNIGGTLHLIYRYKSPSRLPMGFTELEYLESTGAQWINTGVNGSSSVGFEIDFLTNNVVGPASTDFGTILGSFAGNTSTRINLGTWNASQVTTGGEMCWGGTTYNPYITKGVRMQVSIRGTTLTTPNSSQTISGSFSTSVPIAIFARNNNGTADQFSKTRLYSLKMYNGSTLIRDFVPCITSSGLYGLYDIVNSKFYGYVGSDPVISLPYTPVSYIETDGRSYLDTTFNPNQNTRLVINFEFLTETISSIVTLTERQNTSYFGFQASNHYWYVYYGNVGSATSTLASMNTRYTADLNKNTFYVNGSRVIDMNSATFSIPYSIIIGGYKRNSSTSNFTTIRIYSCQIYDNGTLVRDFTPCKYNGSVGMWDKVNDKFYGNSGYGSLIAGAEV